ncbi:hypothetical protein O9K51_02267 [Purpureocillium lavendulum]|uniref:Uncharacterized protein n=1 Tax=Purpureocillium lavendulum TaxID=1247861 RepID=A0AB34FWU7_9HYPO|nr:hypothetical protein O9K51_02267 [Purpureocillium lavendulum]
MIFGNQPGFEHAEKECCRDASEDTSEDKQMHVAGVNQQARRTGHDAVELASQPPSEMVGELAGERRTQGCRNESDGV